VRRKAHRPAQKSDRRDAFELCDGIRRGLYRCLIHVPSPAISRLRTTLSRRRHFVRIQTAEVNATKRLLRGAGWLTGTRPSLRSATSWDRLLEALAGVPELQGHVRFHFAVWCTAPGSLDREQDSMMIVLGPWRCRGAVKLRFRGIPT
jgi:transposase